MSRESPTSIGVVQLGRLGDMVLTTPLFAALGELFPSARVTVLAAPQAALIARHAPGVGDVMEVGRSAIGLAGAVLRLRMRAFDLYIDPKDHPSSTSRMLARSSRALTVIAHPANGPRRGRPLPPVASPGHFVDRMLAPLRLIAPDYVPDRRPRLGLPSESTIVAAQVRAQAGDHYAVVNVSAGVASRYWQHDRTVALAQWLARRMPVVILGAPSDQRLAHSIASTAPRCITAETHDLLEVAAIVAGAGLVVSPDTSIVHVASAYDVPTIGLYPYNPPNLRLFAPLSTRHAALVAPNDGAVADIDESVVISAAERILAGADYPATTSLA
jgi:ADP-heptose:LPS heptosyltransferase